jgi:RNA polymerase sigma-54 factor
MRKISQKTGLKQSQSVMMTPQMQLAMRVLSLSQLELSELIQEKIDENPLLEYADGESEMVPETVLEGEEARDAAREIDLSDSEAWEDGHNIERAREERDFTHLQDSGGQADLSFEAFVTAETTLAEALQMQLRDLVSDEAIRNVALDLVYWLDEDGYLHESDDELAGLLAADLALVQEARRALHACEPRGLAARSLAECFRLQIGAVDPQLDIFLQHLNLVSSETLSRIEDETGLGLSDIKNCIAQLQGLNPHPGRDYLAAPDHLAPPDVILKRGNGGQWYAEVNESMLPALQLREGLWEDLARRDQSEVLQRYLSQHRQAARWLQRTIFTRGMSLLRVSEAIIEEQQAFLDRGINYLKPMTIREIADRVGLNEGTVSRIVANKLVETPFGVWPMKNLFSSAVGQSSDDDGVSSRAVKQRIKALIGAEPPSKPLSDDKLVKILAEEGVPIARRTITKYREALGIGSSVERRKQKQFS